MTYLIRYPGLAERIERQIQFYENRRGETRVAKPQPPHIKLELGIGSRVVAGRRHHAPGYFQLLE